MSSAEQKGVAAREESRPEREESLEQALARGRAPATPFVLLGSVAAIVWAAVALVTVAALLVWWLA